jgi:CspA family cold shock protein
MFSKALLQVLFAGDKRRPEQRYLSLREVADLTEEVITRELEGKAPRPEIHSPDQKEGDIANIPFFPNLADKDKTVKWFNDEEGFGFITQGGGKDVFGHHSVIATEGFSSLAKGQRVDFDVTKPT